jgi:hypothetical protein
MQILAALSLKWQMAQRAAQRAAQQTARETGSVDSLKILLAKVI